MRLISVILAGGQNRRMNGTPKWELKLDNETMLDRTIRRLRSISDYIYIVSEKSYSFPLMQKKDIEVIYDEKSYLGPMNGIYTTLNNIKGNYYFILAADMPFFSTELALGMYQLALKEKQEIVIPKWENKLQPLHGIYSSAIFSSIEQAVTENKLGLIRWLYDQNPNKITFIEQTEAEKFGVNEKTFFNMNYPEEYNQAIGWFKEKDKRE